MFVEIDAERFIVALCRSRRCYGSPRQRIEQMLEWALTIDTAQRQATQTRLERLSKAEAVALLMRCYDEGKVSLCTLEMAPTPPSDEEVRRMAALLEAYKRKVDELLPEGEVFAPEC